MTPAVGAWAVVWLALSLAGLHAAAHVDPCWPLCGVSR